jgi:hypothetical protein
MKIAYDLLPIDAQAEGYKAKKTHKMTSIRQAKMTEKGLRPLGHRSVELRLGVCFQQKPYPRVGYVAGKHRQRAAKWASPI